MTCALTNLQCLFAVFFLLTTAERGVGTLQTSQAASRPDLIVQSDGKLSLISLDLMQLPTLDEKNGHVLPISVRIEEGQIISRYRTKGTKAKILIYERKGKKCWHGVYNLAGEKNNFGVRFPSGGAITWSGLNHKQALHRQLVRTGLKKSEATSLLERHRNEWFREGLRIFYVMDAANAKLTLADKIPEGSSVLMIIVEDPDYTR